MYTEYSPTAPFPGEEPPTQEAGPSSYPPATQSAGGPGLPGWSAAMESPTYTTYERPGHDDTFKVSLPHSTMAAGTYAPPADPIDEKEYRQMSETIQALSVIPLVAAVSAVVLVILVSVAMSTSAWKTGVVMNNQRIQVGLLTFKCNNITGTLPPGRFYNAGVATDVMCWFSVFIAALTAMATFCIALMDRNKLMGLRNQMGVSLVSALPSICIALWSALTGFIFCGLFLYATMAPTTFDIKPVVDTATKPGAPPHVIYGCLQSLGTSLELDASYGLLRLCFLLVSGNAVVTITYLTRMRSSVVTGAMGGMQSHHEEGLNVRPLEVELALQLTQAWQQLADRSTLLQAVLTALLILQAVAVIDEPEWSALLVLIGAYAAVIRHHHLSMLFVSAMAMSVLLGLLHIVSTPPLALITGGRALAMILQVCGIVLKIIAAGAVYKLDMQTNPYQEFLMSQGLQDM